MYIYMGMFFKSPQDVPDFGSITMYFVGTKQLGYVEEGHKRFRKYAFQSTDLNKLSLITNAIDGSEAFAVDTGTTYVLYDGQWSVKSSELNPTKIAEILENITQIDYQIVNQLPQTGVKGTIYLVANETAQGDYYDEYIYTNNAYEKMGNTAPVISTMTGATINAAGVAGLVPAPTSSEKDYFLKGDGTWSQINVTNVIPKVTDKTGEVPKFKEDGTLESTGFTLGKSVPSNAVFTDTTYAAATTETAGLMSATDKTKLDNLDGTNYISKVTNKTGEVPKFNANGQIESTGFTLGKSVPADAVFTDTDTNTTYTLTQDSNDGHKITFASSDANVSDTVITIPDNNTTYTLTQDSNDGHKITFTPSTGSATTITIPDNDTTYNAATQQTAGLMSSTDKTKLDSITVEDLLTTADIIVCTQNEYETSGERTGLLYFIKEDEGGT